MSWRDHRIWNLTRGELAWLAIGVVALAYEVWAVFTDEGDVLTRAYRASTTRWMFWPAGFGVLMGHLHAPALRGIGTGLAGKWGPVALIVLGVVVLCRDFIIRGRYPEMYVLPLFALGFMLGGTLWVGRP